MKKIIENIIFSSRWILISFYLVIYLSLVVYAFFDLSTFIHYITTLKMANKDIAMLTFVELLDMAMIANLGKSIITGSYNSFISKNHGYANENITSGMLKVKTATSLVGITAIALLSKSIVMDIAAVGWGTLYKLAFIHGVFLTSSLVLAYVDYLHETIEIKKDKLEHKVSQVKPITDDIHKNIHDNP